MKTAVIGAGSWGTALASVLASAGGDVVMWARTEEVACGINENHKNPRYLSDATLSDHIVATTSAKEAIESADAIIIVVPSAYLRLTMEGISEYVDSDTPIVLCSKGIEKDTGNLPHQIAQEVFGHEDRIAVLSGPTHAEEVIKSLPSGAVCASIDPQTAIFFRDLFATDTFRTYTSPDITGVELCGAFKNVIAIAVGISYGIGFGDNTATMLITRGMAEMSRMVVAAKGDAMTCLGLAGAGDMVVTCMSRHSRNRRFGQDYVAKGKTLADFENETHMVVEGAIACKTLETLSRRYEVELPITDAIRSIVWEGKSPKEVARSLVERPLKREFYDAN